jgi:hypothetical protein
LHHRGDPVVKENKIHSGDVGVLVLSGGKGTIASNDIYNMMAEGVVIKGVMTAAGEKHVKEGDNSPRTPKTPRTPKMCDGREGTSPHSNARTPANACLC